MSPGAAAMDHGSQKETRECNRQASVHPRRPLRILAILTHIPAILALIPASPGPIPRRHGLIPGCPGFIPRGPGPILAGMSPNLASPRPIVGIRGALKQVPASLGPIFERAGEATWARFKAHRASDLGGALPVAANRGPIPAALVLFLAALLPSPAPSLACFRPSLGNPANSGQNWSYYVEFGHLPQSQVHPRWL